MAAESIPLPPRLAPALPAAAPRSAWQMFFILLLIGLATGIVLALVSMARLWVCYLVNFIFFTGIAQSAVVFSAVTRGCNARWARPVHRLAEGFAVVLPISVVLYIPLMFAAPRIYPWWAHPPRAKLPWLEPVFLWGRDLGVLALLAGLSLWYFYRGARADIGLAREQEAGYSGRLAAWFCRGWRGDAAEIARRERELRFLWVILIFAFVYGYSILGLDLNMSLNIHWYDYLYDWFFFVTIWYAGLAMVTLATLAWRRGLKLTSVLDAGKLHDLGELLFAFAIFWTYLFWAQYMVEWYANEQPNIHLLFRIASSQPWLTIAWITLTLAFFLPFAFGLSRSWKRRGPTLAFIAVLALSGIWLEQNLVVEASIWHGAPPLLASALVGCGFAGLYGLIYLAVMQRLPFFPIADPLMQEAMVVHAVRH